MTSKAKQETREFTRVNFSTRAEVDVNGRTIAGAMHDISMGGVFLCGDAPVQVGDACEVRVFLGDEDPLVIHALGYVARRELRGFAVAFSGFYCDSQSNLKQMIMLNADSHEKVAAEIEAAPTLSLI